MFDPPASTVQQLRAELAALERVPRDQGRAMAGTFYTSPAYLELEREELFRKQWICVGHAGALRSSGDFFTTELVGEPLLVVRDSSSAIRVFSNVCRHRASPVAHGAGNAARFVCSYHGWTYGLDGRLLAAPLIQENEQFAKGSCRLPQFASELWQGYIFVNLDGLAPPLAPALSPIEPYIRNYHPAEQHFLFQSEEVWSTNWKCLVENFMEGYHLSPLHAKTLHPVTPTRLCEKLPDGPQFTGYRANFHPNCPERGPFHPDLTPKERRSDVFYCIYPSFVVGFCPHFTLYMCLRPLTEDTVAVRWGITGIADDPKSAVVQDYVQLCRAFCEEDRLQLERLSKGLRSRAYIPGPLAPDDFEGTIWDIWQYMMRRLGTPPADAASRL
jgi:phenylpropionate dioxygenase-like ring-hydroxylating dioxygenase large terminal subunit